MSKTKRGILGAELELQTKGDICGTGRGLVDVSKSIDILRGINAEHDLYRQVSHILAKQQSAVRRPV